jgi:hypothetical protein
MPESRDVDAEQSRRRLVVSSAVVLLIVSLACAVPQWRLQPEHPVSALALQAVPVACSSAFLIGLCVGFPALSPWSRPTIAHSLSLPALHVAILEAITRLLTSRPSSLIEPLPAQRHIQIWLGTQMWVTTLVAEILVLLLIFGVSFLRRSKHVATC